MKCTNCQGEWTPPQNVSLSKCPFCQSDILQSLNIQAGELTPEVILRNMLQVYGTELLQNEQRLSAMIADLLAYDKKTIKLLLFSVKEKVPQQMAAFAESDQRELKLQALQHHLHEDAFLHEDASRQIIDIWYSTFGWEEPDESFEIDNPWSDEDGFVGITNSKGEDIVSFKYKYCYGFSEGRAMVELNGKFGFINKLGNEIIPLKYDDAESFSEGLARVALNGKWGFIDKTGKEIILFKYHEIAFFREGLCRVKLNDKYGFIDKTGKEICTLKYDNANYFIEGMARVELDGQKGFIDKVGSLVFDSDLLDLF